MTDTACYACREPKPAGASAPGHDFATLKISAGASLGVQPKLTIGDPADPREREADAVAEQVMRSPEQAPCGPTCRDPAADVETLRRQPSSPFSQSEGLIEEDDSPAEETLQAKPLAAARGPATDSVAGRIRALRAGGAALPGALRSFMEPRFGHDFGQVRVHTGNAACDTAQQINARAFTIGRDVVFGRGQFAPASAEGQRLIAHELTHVVQQGRAAPLPQSGDTPATPARGDDGEVIRRVAWSPNKATGKVSHPWGSGGPVGKIFKAATDGGTALDIWRPDDGKTYWCHGYTFGGSTARGGPYSIWGSDVPTVLKDDGWQQTYSCMARPADILVFWDAKGMVAHTGIIRGVSGPGARIDEAASSLESKWGAGSHNTKSWEINADNYGRYRCYSKAPLTGVCNGKGANEL